PRRPHPSGSAIQSLHQRDAPMTLSLILPATIVLMNLATAPPAQDPIAIRPTPEQLAALDLRSGAVQELRLQRVNDEEVSFRVVLAGAPRTVRLWTHALLAKDFRLMVHGDGGDRAVPIPATATFQGALDEVPESVVAATIDEGR